MTSLFHHDPLKRHSYKLLIMDVDGVLNGHVFNSKAESNTIDPACVERINYVLEKTGASIVLSSAWRYMVLGGAMTIKGMDYLFRTHGLAANSIVDILPPDPWQDPRDEYYGRNHLILEYIKHHLPYRYAVVDDGAVGWSPYLPLVVTNGTKGIQDNDAERLIAILNKKDE